MRFFLALALPVTLAKQLLAREQQPAAKLINDWPERPFEAVAEQQLGGARDDPKYENTMDKHQKETYNAQLRAFASMEQQRAIPPPPGATVDAHANVHANAPEWAKRLQHPPQWAQQMLDGHQQGGDGELGPDGHPVAFGHAGDNTAQQEADKGDLALIGDAVDARMNEVKADWDKREGEMVDEVTRLGQAANADVSATRVKIDAAEGAISASQAKLAADLSAAEQAAADEIAKEASDVHTLDVRMDKAQESSELARSMAVGMHTNMMKRDQRLTRLETLVQTNEHRIEAAMDALNSRITELAKETFTETDAIRKEISSERNSDFSKMMSSLQVKSNAVLAGAAGLAVAMMM